MARIDRGRRATDCKMFGIPAEGTADLAWLDVADCQVRLILMSFVESHFLQTECEILEFPTEQNWFDTDNDHFRSADGTRRRSPCFRRHFLASHVISSRRSEATDTRPAASFTLKPGHNADEPHRKRRDAADLRPRARAARS